MTRACSRGIAAALAAAFALAVVPQRAAAALEADPQVLYAQMKAAYAKAAANGWDYFDQLAYLSQIFDAGRAYALQRPDDPAYAEIAGLTVQMGTAMHYNPLTNSDAATWYVREACLWVQAHDTDPALLADASALLERVNAEDGDPQTLARLADEDADALVHAFPHDSEAQILPLQADWRAWDITHDPAWRSKALARAAQPAFPIAHVAYLYQFVDAAQNAISNVPGFTPDDRANAEIVVGRLKHVADLAVIARAHAVPEDVYLTRLAPADEYFGPLGMSVIGMENEIKHVNFMLDYHYGNLESAAAVNVAEAVDDMHKAYPRDVDMAKLLYECIAMLGRMTTPQAEQEAAHLRGILTVEYESSPQAQQLLGAATSP